MKQYNKIKYLKISLILLNIDYKETTNDAINTYSFRIKTKKKQNKMIGDMNENNLKLTQLVITWVIR